MKGDLTVVGDLVVTGDLTVKGWRLGAGSRETPDAALTVYDPTWGVGRVTGLTSELRPIVTWDSGEVRSRSWGDLIFGEGRAF